MYNLIDKIFSSKAEIRKRNSSKILVYVDSECTHSNETSNKTVGNYLIQNNFENDQFLYIAIKSRKTGELILKRRLLGFQYLNDVLTQYNNEELTASLIIGYSTEHNSVPKISSIANFTDNIKFIRSGILQKFSDTKQTFEECQLKLHHDYLTYYKLRSKEKNVYFMPLENASVEIIHEKKHIFTVKDKFKTITLKSASKEDMIGWLLAINEAIKVRNAQIYMNQLDDKLSKKMKDRLNVYLNRCSSLKDSSRLILLDELGRKALRDYLRKNPQNEKDSQLLSLIQTYLYMCKVRREKGEANSQPIIKSIKETLSQIRETLPTSIKQRNFQSKQDLIKAIEEIMKLLDNKYRKILLQKRHLHNVFQSHILDQYKQNSRIPVETIFGRVPAKTNQ